MDILGGSSNIFAKKDGEFMGIDITGIGSVFEFGGKIIDKLWPDKNEADKAKVKLLELQQAGEFKDLDFTLEMAKSQNSVNLSEANSGSNFRGGWRPLAGWVCGLSLAYSAMARPLLIGVVRIWIPEFDIPEVSDTVTENLLFCMLGLGGYRTYEKTKSIV